MTVAAKQRRPLWRWVSRIVLTGGLAWVVVLLARDFRELRSDFQIASIESLLLTIVLGVVALLLIVPVFQSLLHVHSNLHIRYRHAARMLFVAQILRHIPGRIWGIAYLVAETRSDIPSTAMVRANLDTMLYAIYFSALVAVSLVGGVAWGAPLALALFLVGSILLAVAVRFDWFGHVLVAVAKVVPGRVQSLAGRLLLERRMPWSSAIMIVVCVALSWVCYLTVWWMFPRIFPVLEDVNIWLLCASYAAAWFIGYVSMITPSGLGVREASFFAFAGTLTSLPNLAFLAVFVRGWQLIAEITVFVVFALIGPGRGPASRAD